jgi:molybdopterin adenylyltransferase
MGHEGHDHDHDDQHHPHHHGHHEHGHAHPHESHAAKEHKHHAPAQVATFVVTCSDSRSAAQDESGAAIRSLLEGAGHTVVGHKVIRDEPEAIRATLDEAMGAGARAVIFNGGTGIGRRDSTVETLSALFEKTLPGFGELFRALSFKEIGSPAMMSRACAGTVKGSIVFALPGSPQAVKLALRELILPELGHAVRELTR